MEEEVRRLVHIGGTAAKNQSVPVFRPGLSVMQSLGGGSHLWVESPHPGVTPQYGGCGVHTGPPVSSAVGRFQQQLRFQNAFSSWITPGSSPPSRGVTQNDRTQCEISSND